MYVLRNCRDATLDLVRIRAATCYLQGVQGARRGFIAILLLGVCLMLLGCGFVLLHVGLFLLLPQWWNFGVLMGLGGFYILAVLVLLRWLCAEKTWLRFTKAGEFAVKAARGLR